MKTLSDESSEPLLLSYASPSTIPAATPSILFNVNLTPHQARPPPPLHKPPSLTIPKCKSPTSSLPLTDEKPKTTFSIVDRHLRRRSSSLLPQSTTSASTTISSKRHPLLLSHASNHEQAAISGSTSICTSQHGREEAMNKMRLFQPLPHNVAKPQKGYFNETSTSLTAKNGNNIYDSSFSYSNRISPNYYFHYFCYNNETITNILDVKPSILGPRPSILGPCPSSIDTDFTIFNTRLSILGPRRSILGPHPFTFSRENCNYFHPKLTNKKRKSQPSVDFSKKSCTPVDSLPFSRINCPSFNRVKRDREEGIFMFSSVSERPLKKLKSFSKVFKFVVEDDHSQDLYLQKSKMKTKDVIISPPRRVKRARDVDIYCFTTVKLFVKRRKFIDEDQEEIGEEQNPKEFELIIRQKGIDKKDDTGLELEDKHVGNIKIRETQEQTSGNDRKGNENRDVNLEEPHCSDWIDQNSDFEDAVCDFDNSNWDYQDSDFEDAIGDPSSFEQWETTVDTKIMTILQREVTPTYNNYQDLEYHREDADCMDWNYLQRITNGSQESCSPAMRVMERFLSAHLGRDNKLPPGPPRWPIVGNLLQLGQLPHRDLASLCDKYGPLVYLRLGSVDAITTNDPDIIREILLQQDDVFASRPRTLAAVHLAYGCGDVALAPLGPKWKRMRRICMEHLLTTKRLESFMKHRADEAQNLVHDVWCQSQKEEAINLREVLGAFSMNNVTRMLLGKQFFGAESAGKQEAMEFMHITHQLFWLLGLIYLGDYLPFWRWFDLYGCEKKMREVEKRVDDFHARIIEEHRKRKGNKGQQCEGVMDFVDVLLSLPGDDGKEHLDDKDIKALIQDMIAAATDTSSVTNEWAMAEVIKNPDVLKKIQEELDSVVGRDRMVSEADLPHLNYLRCVVRETFRMHPAGPFLIPHESIRSTKINGYYIPAKTRVFINTHALGRNTKIWDDIDEFKPERHLPANTGSRVEISHGADFKILPFSAGKRKCPGAPLGVTLVLMALARLFHSFDWSPPDGMKLEGIDTQEVYGMTMPKAKPLLSVARPRLATHLY